MMKIPKFKTEKIKRFLKKLPGALGKRAFLTFLGLLFLSLTLGSLVFYKYSFLTAKEEAKISGESIQFKEELYQQISERWQEREKRFKGADSKEYFDPFQGVKKEASGPNETSTPETEEEKTTEGEEPTEGEESTRGEGSTNEVNSESPTTEPKIEELWAINNLFEFYKAKGEKLPLVGERAIAWEEKGLGKASEYWGYYYQNIRLLEEFKKELTPTP